MTAKVITANRLVDGRVVYLATDGTWTAQLAQAARFAAAADADAALARVSDDAVVGAYALDVESDGNAIVPRGQREAIRTRGPSVRPDLGYQAGNP